MEQQNIDKANAQFWDELCGTTSAQSHGIYDNSPESIQKFDKIYFDYYPYLLKHVPVHTMSGKKVLEIGLGYGTLGMKIAQSGADYYGLDIAKGPVDMMNYRLSLNNKPEQAKQGSVLICPFPDSSMDVVVSIGCLHHTGNLPRSLDEIHRVLKPGGTAHIMLYNQRSYQQWLKWPYKTFQSVMRDFGIVKPTITVSQDQRAAYDNNTAGQSAPETTFTSIAQVKQLMRHFSTVKCSKENWNGLYFPFHRIFSRNMVLQTVGPILGLDLYITAKK